jgi:hypothetical protein
MLQTHFLHEKLENGTAQALAPVAKRGLNELELGEINIICLE